MNFLGIDKTVIKNFVVIRIDMNKLESEGNKDNVFVLRYAKNRYNYFMEQRQDNFNLIKINDNTLFNSIKIDVKKVGNTYIQYGVLDLSIKEQGNNNLIPLTTNAYKQKVQAVFKYIRERYGIYMDYKEFKFESIELNSTIQLDEEFKEYTRVLKVLMNIAPKTYKIKEFMYNNYTDELETLLLKNKSIQIKFYNKGKQLEEVYSFDTSKNILRIEYTLTSEKMKDSFGHNQFSKLNDENIKDFVKNKFKNDFINPYEKFKKDNKGKLTKLAKQYRKEYKQWIKPFLIHLIDFELKNDKPLLIDIEDLKDIIKVVDKNNFSRNWKQILKNTPNSMQNINIKVEEIFNKIIHI